MPKKLIILLILLAVFSMSCLVGQLKYERQVQAEMETLLTNPSENILAIIEEWNAQPDLTKGRTVDLENIQEYVLRFEYDNKKGLTRMWYAEGLDFESQRILCGQVMVILGSLYWQIPEQKRDVITLSCYLDDIENLVFIWKRGGEAPEIDSDRMQNFM